MFMLYWCAWLLPFPGLRLTFTQTPSTFLLPFFWCCHFCSFLFCLLCCYDNRDPATRAPLLNHSLGATAPVSNGNNTGNLRNQHGGAGHDCCYGNNNNQSAASCCCQGDGDHSSHYGDHGNPSQHMPSYCKLLILNFVLRKLTHRSANFKHSLELLGPM